MSILHMKFLTTSQKKLYKNEYISVSCGSSDPRVSDFIRGTTLKLFKILSHWNI